VANERRFYWSELASISAAVNVSSTLLLDFAATQQETGAEIRSDAWAATPANANSISISVSLGGVTPRTSEYRVIQVWASTVMALLLSFVDLPSMKASSEWSGDQR
jgi:hypothetical protein